MFLVLFFSFYLFFCNVGGFVITWAFGSWTWCLPKVSCALRTAERWGNMKLHKARFYIYLLFCFFFNTKFSFMRLTAFFCYDKAQKRKSFKNQSVTVFSFSWFATKLLQVQVHDNLHLFFLKSHAFKYFFLFYLKVISFYDRSSHKSKFAFIFRLKNDF